MNGAILLLPFLAVRFGLLGVLDRRALPRAAHFAPMEGGERIAYGVYQLSNAGIFLALFFLRVRAGAPLWFVPGLLCYLLGLALCAASMASFAAPDGRGLNTRGLYRFSRNPMYVAYLICFAGMGLLTRSPLLLGLVAVFQVSAHWIVLAEERWCRETFGEAYERYSEKARRYI